MSSARGASSWTAAIAACSWYGPIGARVSVAVDQRDALGDRAAVPARAVLLGERDAARRRRPVRAGAAGVGQQHQREQPGDLAVVGQQPVQLAGQPDRLVRAARPAAASRPLLPVYPSLKIR